MLPDFEHDREVLAAIKAKLPELRALQARAGSHWEYEDPVYRFYHGSFKVYGLQRFTLEIVGTLQALLPDVPLNESFRNIVAEGTGKTFTLEANAKWESETRPILEAFFHARYFLEMAVKYGSELDAPPNPMPSGWAALLYLYNLR